MVRIHEVMIEMPLALVPQQAAVGFAQVQPVVNELVVEKPQPKTGQQRRGCKETPRYRIKTLGREQKQSGCK